MSEENTAEVKVLEAQIDRLQAEIETLQLQQQNHNKDITLQIRGKTHDAVLYLCGQKQGGEEQVMARLKEEVDELEEDLKWQTQMNGICLNTCITKTLESNCSKLVQQHCVTGRCSKMIFQVDFEYSEIKEAQGFKKRIKDFNVVMDASDLQNFSSFLTSVEERNDLRLFFKTLTNFSDRWDIRCKTFEHFQQKYPSVVSVPGGSSSEVMILNHPKLPGCVLFIHWSVEVSTEGEVTPKIELLTKIPEEALQLFTSKALGGAGEAFHSLLRILGPEAAIESVIRAVILES